MTTGGGAAFRPAISALAWPAAMEESALPLARGLGFEGVEILPIRLFGPPEQAQAARIARWRRRIEEAGLSIAAMQGVLFGLEGLHLFRSAEERAAMAAALRAVARVAGLVDAPACVFGAAALRDPAGLAREAAWDIARGFLAALAPAFEEAGTVLCFEPVAPANGGRFVTTTAEAARLVREVGRPGVRLQLDTGNLLEMGWDEAVLREAVPLAGHLHLSEPGLVTPGTAGSDHAALAGALRRAGWRGWVSVEMLPAAAPEAAMAEAWRCAAAYRGCEAA